MAETPKTAGIPRQGQTKRAVMDRVIRTRTFILSPTTRMLSVEEQSSITSATDCVLTEPANGSMFRSRLSKSTTTLGWSASEKKTVLKRFGSLGRVS